MWKKDGNNKKKALIKILSVFGHIPIVREEIFCRHCHEGHGIIDNMLEINDNHRMTNGMVELSAYIGQLIPSFDKASEVLKKLSKIDVCGTQIQIVSEEIGKKVFEKDHKNAEIAYKMPEEVAPQELLKNRKKGRLYILADGLQVNTRIKDGDGSTWREMKLGLVFYDGDVITRENSSAMIIKKEYVSYFGCVEEFKKMLFAAAARAGYGRIEEIVLIGDGAQWIWNMCKELFPDAVKILDFYHVSENVNSYAKYLYPEDEVSRKIFVDKILNALLEDHVQEAIDLVALNRVEKSPSSVINLSNYLETNRDKITYKSFKDAGYYIGSGAIESANKMVIQQRMKQSGMRWGLNGGQYIASLRAKYESNLWNNVVEIIEAA